MSKEEIKYTIDELRRFQAQAFRARLGVFVTMVIMYIYLIIYTVRHPP